MCDLEALPGEIEMQLFVGDLSQGLAARTDSFIAEVLIWHAEAFCGPFHQGLRRNSGELNAQRKGGEQVIKVAYSGGQNVHMPVAIVVHSLDVLNHTHAAFAVIV
jgi:hypothetical protein